MTRLGSVKSYQCLSFFMIDHLTACCPKKGHKLNCVTTKTQELLFYCVFLRLELQATVTVGLRSDRTSSHNLLSKHVRNLKCL